MKTLTIPLTEDLKPCNQKAKWGRAGCPHYGTCNWTTVEVRFTLDGVTLGVKKYLWVHDDVVQEGERYRHEGLGYMPSSDIGGQDRGSLWMLLEIEQLGELFKTALRAVAEAEAFRNRESSEEEARLLEVAVEAQEAENIVREDYHRLLAKYDMLEERLGYLISK